jgi:hypothetical protein
MYKHQTMATLTRYTLTLHLIYYCYNSTAIFQKFGNILYIFPVDLLFYSRQAPKYKSLPSVQRSRRSRPNLSQMCLLACNLNRGSDFLNLEKLCHDGKKHGKIGQIAHLCFVKGVSPWNRPFQPSA